MIPHPAFETHPWMLRENHLDRDRLAQTESVFALGNGHIGVRGNLDEGEPHGLPGTYLNGFYEARPLPYAEAGYGYPEAGQTVVNVTNGKLIRLLVDDELFDLRYGRLLHHERTLDFRTGLLHREVDWHSPGHRPGPGAQHADGVPGPAGRHGHRVRGRGAGRAGQGGRAVRAGGQRADPRDQQGPAGRGGAGGAAGARRSTGPMGVQGYLAHRTRRSGLRLAAAMTHVCDAPKPWETETESYEDSARVTVIAELKPGEKLRLVKLVAYGWSAERSVPALRDQVAAALAAAGHTGWDGMLAEQRAVPRRVLGPRRRARRRRPGDPAGGPVRRCSRSSRPARGPRAGPSRPRA